MSPIEKLLEGCKNIAAAIGVDVSVEITGSHEDGFDLKKFREGTGQVTDAIFEMRDHVGPSSK